MSDNEKSKPVKYDYQDLINEMQIVSGYSYYKARTLLRDLSKVLQHKIAKGTPIVCEGLFKIYFTSNKENNIYVGETYGILEQAQDLSVLTQRDKNEILSFLRNLYNIVKTKVEQGYQVNIKGVCYLIPTMDEHGNIFIQSRMSPQLLKPEVSEFVVFKPDGKIVAKTLEKKDLRLATDISEDLRIPNRIVTEMIQEVEYINLKA